MANGTGRDQLDIKYLTPIPAYIAREKRREGDSNAYMRWRTAAGNNPVTPSNLMDTRGSTTDAARLEFISTGIAKEYYIRIYGTDKWLWTYAAGGGTDRRLAIGSSSGRMKFTLDYKIGEAPDNLYYIRSARENMYLYSWTGTLNNGEIVFNRSLPDVFGQLRLTASA
jgi:hypothetical protein